MVDLNNHKAFGRKPDFVIGAAADPQLLRWYVIPRNRFFNVYLHKFLRSDEDRALHDHPWWSLGMIIKRSYLEHVPNNNISIITGHSSWKSNRSTKKILRKAWRPVFRLATHIHRIELVPFTFDEFDWKLGWKTISVIDPVWTIFITGPRIREWGFWCKKGFVPKDEFVSVREGGNAVGEGCD